MNKLIASTVGLIALLAMVTSACSGVLTTETREVSGFHEVSMSTFGEVRITQGDTESLTVEAPSNFLRYLETYVENGVLYISMRRGFLGGPANRVIFTLTVKDLDGLSLSGAGTIKVMDGLQCTNLNINLSGAGSIEVDNLAAESVNANLSSAGAIIIAGKVDSQSVNLSGVGGFEAGDLESKSTLVNLTGAGGAVVWATEELDVTVSGVGSINYYGDPRVTQNVTGLGSVNSKGEHS